MGNRIDYDKWDLVRRTYLRLKSIRRTASIIGMSKTGVEYILKSLEVPRYSRSRSGSENSSRKTMKPGTVSAKIRDHVFMRKMYIEDDMSTTQIGKQIGCTASTVRTGLIQCGIQLRSISESLTGRPRPKSWGPFHWLWKDRPDWVRACRMRLRTVWRNPILVRDNYMCQWCEPSRSNEVDLVVHHCRPFYQIALLCMGRIPDFAEDQLLLLIDLIVEEHTLDDGITLCNECHRTYHREHGQRYDLQ